MPQNPQKSPSQSAVRVIRGRPDPAPPPCHPSAALGPPARPAGGRQAPAGPPRANSGSAGYPSSRVKGLWSLSAHTTPPTHQPLDHYWLRMTGKPLAISAVALSKRLTLVPSLPDSCWCPPLSGIATEHRLSACRPFSGDRLTVQTAGRRVPSAGPGKPPVLDAIALGKWLTLAPSLPGSC